MSIQLNIKNSFYENWSKLKLINKIHQLEKNKKYGLVWDEEYTKEVFECELENKLPILIENKSKKLIGDKVQNTNVLIEGDNYHTLAVLNYTHEKKINVIYIDPPYNSGNTDFKYNDTFVKKGDSYKHSRWLSFMKKRLQLAKKLLSDTGVIFISIDDNEQAQLKLLCDDIFGQENFLTTLYIQVRYPGKTLVEDMDYQKLIELVFVYGKTHASKLNKEEVNYSFEKFIWEIKIIGKPKNKIKLDSKNVEIYDKKDYKIIKTKPSNKNLKEIWATGKILDGNSSGRFFRDYLIPRQNDDDLCTLYKVSGIGDDVYDYRYFTGPRRKGANKGKYYQGVPKNKLNSPELNKKNLPVNTFVNFQDSFGNCRHEGNIDFRSGKKPIAFIQHLLKLGMIPTKNNIVLDFFSGSGSTGHAVLELNKKTHSNHKFILCTNNEDRICSDICYPRLQNVIKGYRTDQGKKIDGIGGNLKYFKTGFVNYEHTDQNKKIMVEQSTEMICLKEDCFELVKNTKKFKIFKNSNDVYVGIVYYYDGIEQFKKEVLRLSKKINAYVFSLTDEVDTDDFVDVEQWVSLKPIPSAILNVYRRIFTYGQITKLSRKTRQ